MNILILQSAVSANKHNSLQEVWVLQDKPRTRQDLLAQSE